MLWPPFATFSKTEADRNSLNVTYRDFPSKQLQVNKPPKYLDVDSQQKHCNQPCSMLNSKLESITDTDLNGA